MGFTMGFLRYDELIRCIKSYYMLKANSERDLLYLLEQPSSFWGFNERHKHTVGKDGAHDYDVEQCGRWSQEKHDLKATDFRKPKAD